MGIALPQFLLNIDGASGGILLLWIVGVCILLPLVIAVVYLSRSSKYTGNYVMHQTLSAYYYFMKPSLAPRYNTMLYLPSCIFPPRVLFFYIEDWIQIYIGQLIIWIDNVKGSTICPPIWTKYVAIVDWPHLNWNINAFWNYFFALFPSNQISFYLLQVDWFMFLQSIVK